jgi:hypothetical protein
VSNSGCDHIDAENWFDLQEKIRFTSYTGGKHYLENFSYLPTTIMNIVNGTPEYAQWNYRISCHPLKHDLPFPWLPFYHVGNFYDKMLCSKVCCY